MSTSTKIWVRIALINLCIVAGLGTLMRYKIGFEFPHFNQKYLQEAHSHFAFTGWITHCLFFLIVNALRDNLNIINEKVYTRLIIINLITAYGMLVSFSFQGYGSISILFSSASLLTGYFFAYFSLRDLNKFPKEHPGKKWIQAAISLSVLSTVGTMVLSQMMATKNYDQDTYLGSIYFYLHFQYNGWFFLACIGLLLNAIRDNLKQNSLGHRAFWLIFLSCVPAYFLSTLWANLPLWLYIIVVIAAVTQLVGWYYLIKFLRINLNQIKSKFTGPTLLLFLVVTMAVSLKYLLQLGSTIPFISTLAFGFRPIVIAYLHLVLLVITTLFLLSYMMGTGLIRQNRTAKSALFLFTGAAILTEFVLMIQGIAGFSYTVVPLAKEMLLLFACFLFGSSVVLFFRALIKDKNDLNQPLL